MGREEEAGPRSVRAPRYVRPLTSDPRNPALEAAIANDPFDREAYRVYADWLEGQGDVVRAQLIGLQLANETGKPLRKLMAEHQDYLLGPLARLKQRLTWKYGFIHGASLVPTDGNIEHNLANLLEHPSGRFLVELAIAGHHLDDEVAILRKAPPSLRTLSINQEGPKLLSLHSIAAVIARLHTLRVYGAITLHDVPLDRLRSLSMRVPSGQLRLAGALEQLTIAGNVELEAIDLPHLRFAQLELPITPTTAAAIANAPWPALARLMLAQVEPGLLAPLFRRDDMPVLSRLVIRGSSNPEQLVRLLRDAPCAKQLVHLELSNGALDDAAARLITREAFPALEELDASDNPLSDAGYDALDALDLPELVDDRRYDEAGE